MSERLSVVFSVSRKDSPTSEIEESESSLITRDISKIQSASLPSRLERLRKR